MNGFRLAGELFLDKKDFVELLIAKFPVLQDGEFTLGQLIDNGNHIMIPFAVNTECHPTQETTNDDTPEWLAKQQKGDR